MIVSVIGLGYIGLPTAAVLASRDVKVVGVDINQHIVDTINQGKVHIIEPDLDILVRASVLAGCLRATVQPEKADIFIIAVPTPFKGDHEPDLSYIASAVKTIAPILEKGNLVILESTSPVGTTEKMIQWMQDVRPDLLFPHIGDDEKKADVAVAYCPERVLPGQVLRELIENDRIIGGVTKDCAEKCVLFYKTFVKGDCLITDARTAELSKLVENSFRDVNIAFANELSLVCDKLRVDVRELICLANHHPRVAILQPGAGVGGHCIAVDPWFIVDSAPDEARLIHTARVVNDAKPHFILEKIEQIMDSMGKEKTEISIACLGLAFKADIDDLRGSPALKIAQYIDQMGFKVHYVVEPNINCIVDEMKLSHSKLTSLDEAILKSDIIVFLVSHAQFYSINHKYLVDKYVLDTVGMLERGNIYECC